VRHTAAKGAERQMAHELRKDELALMHRTTGWRQLKLPVGDN